MVHSDYIYICGGGVGIDDIDATDDRDIGRYILIFQYTLAEIKNWVYARFLCLLSYLLAFLDLLLCVCVSVCLCRSVSMYMNIK